MAFGDTLIKESGKSIIGVSWLFARALRMWRSGGVGRMSVCLGP